MRPMKTNFGPIYLAVLVLVGTGLPVVGAVEQPMVGGFARESVTNEQVVAAATFAIQTQEKALRKEPGAESAKLELIAILRAERQVVAGMNYRLNLKVKLNGQEKTADAIVWWQAWRKPEPYQLTAWHWK